MRLTDMLFSGGAAPLPYTPAPPVSPNRRRAALPFRANAAAASTAELTATVLRDGRIDAIRVRIYAGPGSDLKIYMFVRDGQRTDRNILDYVTGGKAYIDGDDDTFVFYPDQPVYRTKGDVIYVRAVNADAVNAYDFSVDMDVIYDMSRGY